jgi:hypothetical protein
VKSQEVTSGQSVYVIDRRLEGTSPPFHIRPEERGSENLPKPDADDPINPAGTGPTFTFKGRPKTTEHPNTAPYRQRPTTAGESHNDSLESYHPVKDPIQSPGPNYIPPPLGTDANKYSMASMTDIQHHVLMIPQKN